MNETYGPLGLYVHWPFCKAKCPYCDFNSHVSESIDFKRFESGLLHEIEHLANRLPVRPKLHSIFFGGGTPSLMPPSIVAAVINRANQIFDFEDGIEITTEANPTSVEAANLAAFRGAGVNRVSLGVQSLSDTQLRFLGREHSVKESLAALDTIRQIFDRVSIDLIYGLPDQSLSSWTSTMQTVLDLGLDHLSLYQLTIESGTAFYSRAQRGAILTGPDDVVAGLFTITNDMTRAAGLAAYEVSNYARPGHECRHNLIYWRAQNWLGIGPGAHSRFDYGPHRIALATRRSPAAWLEMTHQHGQAIDTDMRDSALDRAAEMLMMGLRLSEGVCLDRVEAACGPRANWLDQKMLDQHIGDGFVFEEQATDGMRITTTPQGRLFLNRILADILI
jgi:oxygen-independent coproporphyrinogen-3 oxidase